MPTYEYRCKDCGNELEAVQAFTDDPLTECPSCSGTLKKKFSAVGISFKGDGFYKTDSRPSSAKGSGTSTSEGSGASSDSSTGSSTDASSSKDAAPAASKDSASAPSPAKDSGSTPTKSPAGAAAAAGA